MKTDRLPHQRNIDLTGRLINLHSSLTPDCKLFEPAPPRLLRERPHPARSCLRLGLVGIGVMLLILLWHLL